MLKIASGAMSPLDIRDIASCQRALLPRVELRQREYLIGLQHTRFGWKANTKGRQSILNS